MVITCEQCTTSFQLDDSRVPEKGVRVRCSRCQHAFFVKPGAESGNDPVESVVSQAIARTPDHDPNAETGTVARAHRTPADMMAAPEAVSDLSDAPESDWEFNHDEDAGHGAAMVEAEDMIDDLLDAGSTQDAEHDVKSELFGNDESADVGGEVEDEIAALLGETSEPLADTAENSATGDVSAVPDASAQAQGALLDEAELPAAPAAPAESGLDLAEDEPLVDDAVDTAESVATASSADEPKAAAAKPASASEGGPLAGLTDEELGSPDEWDFFAEEAGGGAALEAGSESVGSLGASDTALAQVQVGPSGNLDTAPAHADLPAIEREPSIFTGTFGRVGAGVGWVATLALVAGVLWLGLDPRPVLQPVDTATHALDGVLALRLDNALAGPIVVVEGVLRSEDLATGGSGKRFAVEVLDASGAVLLDDAASFGPALSDAALRELSPLTMRETATQEAEAAAWGPVAASPARKLHAVLATLPENATHLRVVHVAVEPPPLPAEGAPPADSPTASAIPAAAAAAPVARPTARPASS